MLKPSATVNLLISLTGFPTFVLLTMSSQEPFLSRRCLVNDPPPPLLWVKFCPPKRLDDVLTPGPVNLILLGNQDRLMERTKNEIVLD